MSDPQRALERLLASDLDVELRQQIATQLEEGTSAQAILESVDSTHLLAATAGEQALSESEADDLFAGIVGAIEAEPRQPRHATPTPPAANNARYFLAALAFAAVALLAVRLVPDEQPYTGLKGDGALTAPGLRVFLGNESGGIDRELQTGEAVPAGSALLFRYTTQQPARAVLLVDDGAAAQTAWTGPSQPPGEHELVADGQALAWTVDSPVTFGLRLLDPASKAEGLGLADHCGDDDPCARFTVTVGQ